MGESPGRSRLSPPVRSGGPRRGAFRVRGARGAALLASLLLAVPPGPGPAPAAGQTRAAAEDPNTGADFATPFLPSDHWALDALRRLQGMALLPAGFDAVTASVTRREAALMLRTAWAAAHRSGPQRRLADAYLTRFAEEFPAAAGGVSGDGEAPPWPGGSSAAAGFETRRDGLLARRTHPDRGPGTSPLSDLDDPVASFDLALLGGPAVPPLAAGASLRHIAGGWRLAEGYAVAAGGPVGVWAGRRTPGFRPGSGGGIVLSPGVPLDGAGLFLREGVRLPAFLRHLGAWRFETFLARLDRALEIEDPWFFGLRASVAPHRRIRIGVNRGALFGGSNHPVSATFGRVVRVVAGLDNSDEGLPANFESQIGSLDVRLIPPLGPWPLALYGEWGVEDLSTRRLDQPALVLGAHLAALPGLEELEIGVEWTVFDSPPSRGSRGDWYHHNTFGTWTEDGRLLGHPLGGEGEEWRIYGGVDLAEARLRLRWHGFVRDRGDDNLFAPERAGASRGVGGRLRARVDPRLEIVGGGVLEDGEGWRETRAFALLRTFF